MQREPARGISKTAAPVPKNSRQIVRRILMGVPLAADELEAAGAKLQADFWKEHITDDEPDLSSVDLLLDFLIALTQLEPDDPAHAWNAGLVQASLGRDDDAATLMLEAAWRWESLMQHMPSEADVIVVQVNKALFEAGLSLLRAGRPVSAAVTWRRITDAELGAELKDEIEKALLSIS